MTDISELYRVARLTDPDIKNHLGVSDQTLRRWKNKKQQIHPAALQLLLILGGTMPWPGWDRFHVQDGLIVAPGSGQGVTPGEVAALPFIQQRIQHLEKLNAAPAQYYLDI